MYKKRTRAGDLTIIDKEKFKEWLLKKHASVSSEKYLNRIKYLARRNLLNKPFEEMEIYLWTKGMSNSSRGLYKSAYRKFHDWRQQV